MMQDFKQFIMRGNVLDLAVAVIIGSAFGKIVSSVVNDMLMPIIGILLGKVDFKTLKLVVEKAQGDTPEIAVYYGRFIQNIVDFVIIAFVIFIMIRLVDKIKPAAKAPAPPAEPPADVQLLKEIRDILKTNKTP